MIVTELTANSTPIREWDYMASFDTLEEGPFGLGATPQEATEDLKERARERDLCPFCGSNALHDYPVGTDARVTHCQICNQEEFYTL